MPQNQGGSLASGARPDGSNAATAVAANFVLGAGWGASTFVVTAGSTDVRGEIVITAATGGGLAQATATIAHTFAAGVWAAIPWATVKCTNTSSLTAVHEFTVNQAATTTALCTWTSQIIPVNAAVYTVRYGYSQ